MLNELLEAWRRELGQALEMMTGTPYPVSVAPGQSTLPDEMLWYSQQYAGRGGAFAVGAEEHVWNELGTRALQGAGIDLIEREEARSTYFEMVQQSISGAARAVSRGGATLELADGGSSDGPPAGAVWFAARVTTPDGLELPLVVAVDLRETPGQALPGRGTSDTRPVAGALENRGSLPERAMDVLLDVHLPISISFGQAQLRLKDVLKLTTGSVVELNRQPEEPVDIVVNDYVIARGEVVTVDGNYAVRIQEIVSRQERLGLRDASGDGTRKVK
jgi:flagellar motor switch protein FliN/FliY